MPLWIDYKLSKNKSLHVYLTLLLYYFIKMYSVEYYLSKVHVLKPKLIFLCVPLRSSAVR